MADRGQLSLFAVDCELYCPCGAMFPCGVQGARRAAPPRNPLAARVLLALLNGAFDLGVFAFGRREPRPA